MDLTRVFAAMPRALDRRRDAIASDKIIIADLLTDIADGIRGKPAPRTNGHSPPPDSMERWAVV